MPGPDNPPSDDRFDESDIEPPTQRAGLADPHLTTERILSIPVPQVDARATLTILRGVDAGQIVALGEGEIVLGRGPGVDVTFEDAAVSRRHARVVRQQGAYVLEDLGSTNGTF